MTNRIDNNKNPPWADEGNLSTRLNPSLHYFSYFVFLYPFPVIVLSFTYLVTLCLVSLGLVHNFWLPPPPPPPWSQVNFSRLVSLWKVRIRLEKGQKWGLVSRKDLARVWTQVCLWKVQIPSTKVWTLIWTSGLFRLLPRQIEWTLPIWKASK